MKRIYREIGNPTSEQLERALRRDKLRKETRKAVANALATLLVFAAAAVLISTLLLPVAQVQKGSMNPTLYDGEVLIFDTVGSINKGDIIAFRYNNQLLIKRVIATAGDKIDISGDGTVLLNDAMLSEPYVTQPDLGECTIKLPLNVPRDQYFVMGDHRATSLDSRSADIGLISREQVVGKLLLRVWPLSKFGAPR